VLQALGTLWFRFLQKKYKQKFHACVPLSWFCGAGKSALQVSKKFNIPSRTLYDKVKKMGITTGRQQQRKSLAGSFNGEPIFLLFAPLFAKLFNLYIVYCT
jgi:hypothetical protein